MTPEAIERACKKADEEFRKWLDAETPWVYRQLIAVKAFRIYTRKIKEEELNDERDG